MGGCYDFRNADKRTISKHIFEDAELEPAAVVWLFRTTAADGKQHTVEHYKLDMVLEVKVINHFGDEVRKVFKV